jgi:isoflavone 2'-hydroxylase
MMLIFMITAFAAVLQKQPPGPPSLPSVMSTSLGSLPLIGMGKAVGIGPPPHERMQQLADRFGDVMTLEMGREPWVILSSPEAVHEAFVVKGKEFSGRPMVASMNISSGKGKGFAKKTLDPGLIKLRQKAFGELFDAQSVQRAQEHFDAETELLVDHLVSSSISSEYGGGGVEIRPALRRAVTNMVLRYAFSARVPYEGEESVPTSITTTTPSSSTESLTCTTSSLFVDLVDVVDQLWEELTSTKTFLVDLTVDPRLVDVYYGGISSIPSLVKKRDSLLRTIVSDRRRSRQQNKTTIRSNDMLDVLLDASLPESDLMYTLVDLFVAGVNTVSTTLEWMLLLTADEPQYQTRARVDAIASGSTGRSNTNNNNTDDHSQRPSYVDALIKETLRSKPPLLLPRRSIADTSIGKYEIPAGRVVMANNWALTHDGRWWNNPESFRPERWLKEEDRVFQGIESCKFIPYSIGRRACPGSRLAQAELTTATRGLLRSVSWCRVESKIDLREEYSLTLAPTVSQSLSFRRLKTGRTKKETER